jgi:hypothetical protein
MPTDCGTITVVPAFNESDVYVSACNLQTTSITPGETVDVGSPVNNDNDTSVQATVELFVNGSSEAIDTRTIAENQAEAFTFEFTPQSAGDYDLSTEVTSASRA